MCSGSSRGMSQPHVPGVQWGHGAIGNAKWRGVRLRDLLHKGGVKEKAGGKPGGRPGGRGPRTTTRFRKRLSPWGGGGQKTLGAIAQERGKHPRTGSVSRR